MCIDDADGLQIGVDDGGADESHAVRLEIHCDGVGQRGCSHACLVDDVTAGEPPNIVVETAVRRLDIPECVGITDRRDDFATVADDARIVHEFGDLVLVIAPDPFDVEPIERLTETLALDRKSVV